VEKRETVGKTSFVDSRMCKKKTTPRENSPEGWFSLFIFSLFRCRSYRQARREQQCQHQLAHRRA
jgi:hypothetical protein